MMLLNETYGFKGDALAAPQAHAMAAVIAPLMSGQEPLGCSMASALS